jgi:hypothetical protein
MAKHLVLRHSGARIPGAKYLERYLNAHGRYVYRYKPRAFRPAAAHEAAHGEKMAASDWSRDRAPAPAVEAPSGLLVGDSQHWQVSEKDRAAFKRAVLERRDWSIKRKHYDLWYDSAYARIHVPDADLPGFAMDCLELVDNGVDFVWWKDA